MSTTRSQKRKNNQQESTESVGEGSDSPMIVENPCLLVQDADIAGHSRPKSPRIESSFLESLKASLREEITSEIKSFAISKKELSKLLKPRTRENVSQNTEEEPGE